MPWRSSARGVLEGRESVRLCRVCETCGCRSLAGNVVTDTYPRLFHRHMRGDDTLSDQGRPHEFRFPICISSHPPFFHRPYQGSSREHCSMNTSTLPGTTSPSGNISSNPNITSFVVTSADVAGVVIGWVVFALILVSWAMYYCRRYNLQEASHERSVALANNGLYDDTQDDLFMLLSVKGRLI